MQHRLKRKSSHCQITPPDRLRPFLNESGTVEFAVRHVRVAIGDPLYMLVDDQWLAGRFRISTNPEGPQLEVAADDAHRIQEDTKLRAMTGGPLAPLPLLIPRPEFIHPRCTDLGIRFMLEDRLLNDGESVEIDIEGRWREGLMRLPLHHEQAIQCDMPEQWLALVTCQTRVRRRSYLCHAKGSQFPLPCGRDADSPLTTSWRSAASPSASRRRRRGLSRRAVRVASPWPQSWSFRASPAWRLSYSWDAGADLLLLRSPAD